MKQHEPIRRRARLLMAGQDQFGYLTDSYQFASHLRDTFEITYLGRDEGLPRVAMDGVRVVYLPRVGGKLRGLLKFLAGVFREIRRGKFDLVYISHFPGAGLYPLFMPRGVFVMDVRTGYVRQGGLIRWIMNREIFIDSLMFRHVTVISESLREVLGINKSKVRVVPLGADMPELPPRRFDGMHLLYVGSLEVRHIDRTVAGFARFHREFHAQIPLTYDIVGFGPRDAEQRLRAAIVDSGCAGVDFSRQDTLDGARPVPGAYHDRHCVHSARRVLPVPAGDKALRVSARGNAGRGHIDMGKRPDSQRDQRGSVR